MASSDLYFEFSGTTDVGVRRKNNEDSLGAWVYNHSLEGSGNQFSCSGMLGKAVLLVVADGMGGAEAGEVASQYAVKTTVEFWEKQFSENNNPSPEEMNESWKNILSDVHAVLRKRATEDSSKGMGTTYTAMLVIGDQGYWAQCGDSRMYRLKLDMLDIVTPDQSPVGKLFQMGEITEEQARGHPYKNIIDQCLGGDGEDPFAPEFGVIELEHNDCFLLCSDGVMDGLRDKEIGILLSMATSEGAELAAGAIVDQAKAQSGKDNITGIVLRVSEEELEPSGLVQEAREGIVGWVKGLLD